MIEDSGLSLGGKQTMMGLDVKKKKRGFVDLGGAAGAFVGLMVSMFIIVILLYAGQQLVTSLNLTNITLIWNNTVGSVINFTGQLGTAGTILGVALILLVVLAVFRYKGSGGGTGM